MSVTRGLKGKLNPRSAVVFSAIALIPLIYAGLLTSANEDPTHHLDSVPAAIVNEDQGATSADGSDLDLGDSLADELTSTDSESNFRWSAESAEQAAADLESGDVYAVLTVPADFSENVASIGGDDPDAAVAGTLTVETNDGANLIVGTIAANIGTAVTESLKEEVSETYLENVYLGFTDVHASLQDAAEGAGELTDGATDAASGSSELVVGLTSLQDGTTQLADGASDLAAGAADASTGAQSLSAGLGQLQSAAAALPDRVTQLDGGAQAVATGAQTLHAGLGDLVAGATSLDDGAGALAAGAADAATGADSLATGTASLRDGVDGALAGAQQLASGAGQLAESTPALGEGADAVSAGLQNLVAGYGAMTDEQRMAALTQLEAASEQLASGAHAVDDGASGLAAGAHALVGDEASGLTALDAGAASVAGGAADLAPGTRSLADGAATLHDGADSLVAGAQQAADGAAALDDGAGQVADGTSALVSGMGPLTTGISDAASGAQELASGNGALADGASTLAAGAASAAAGSSEATSGAQTLADGLGSLVGGAQALSDGLEDGVDEVPTYTDEEASSLSGIAATPVTLDADRINEVPGYGYGLAPYFMALALWVGALAFYLMSSPLRERLIVLRRPSWEVALRSFLPGALMGVAQGVLAALVLRFAVGIEATNLPGLIGIAVLTSVTFIAINQALIALLDAPGRFLALLMIVLQLSSAGGTYPIETAPAFFQTIHGVLPLTYSVEAFRSLIAGGAIGVAQSVLVLACWLVGALLLTLLASVLRRRRATGRPTAQPAPAAPVGPEVVPA
ncbi:YhgE/Pip domain-containing protein [Microbacterium oryzae]|uniref:YhgE/Pip domain-containing protein n=1 Tax=Microbacterium oryzae TaxID=743009 RepID=UPI0025AF1E15|nr:YhgE/Pip domain-containing protein [Microbacterium oryzae]MDN3310802.1 YhgE/Pip domain-containing protein [Microbacterium oryzae]